MKEKRRRLEKQLARHQREISQKEKIRTISLFNAVNTTPAQKLIQKSNFFVTKLGCSESQRRKCNVRATS